MGSSGRSEGVRSGGTRAGSGRPIWVLGAVGVVLALLILPYFQKWLVQRSEIESAKAQLSQSKTDVAVLQQQKSRWADDEYVKAQARQRLHYVMPGEIGYVVIQPKKAAAKPADPSVQAASVPAGDRPWYSDVWLSAQVAADPDGSK
jgi:cell division protein FtsB